MKIHLDFELPDDASITEIVAYLREVSDSAAGQLELGIIPVPEVDERTMIDFQDDREANFWRSE